MTPAETIDALTNDPHPLLAEMRSESPIHWSEALGGWVVTTRATAIEVMRNAEGFTVDHPGFTTSQVIGRSMLSTDGPEHRAHRHPFVAPYDRPHTANHHRPQLTALAQRLVDEIRPLQTGDLRALVCAPMATRAILDSLAMTTPVDSMTAWYSSIVAAVHELSERRQPKPDDGVERLRDAIEATATKPHSVLHHLEGPNLVENTMVLLFGAIETGDGMIANLLWYLHTNPDQLAIVRANAMLPEALEESLRLEPAATRVDRFATRDITTAGSRIKRGDLVIVSLAAANRDPQVFDEPDRFDVRRHNARTHLAFAVGPHACLGAHFARAEALAAVQATLTLPDLRLTNATMPTGLVFRKPSQLQATWH